ncbi:MAG: transcriptional regulator, partial [Anaerolineae bacterium]|nr:transcriptional regulator [Anaerolineae bacterium]
SGLVTVRQDAQRHWYEIRTEPLQELDAWLKSYRHLWIERFDRLDDYLEVLQEEKNGDDKDSPE